MFKQIIFCAIFLAGCLTCNFLLGVQSVKEDQHRRVALVIGNSTYENAALRNPKRDAEAITKSLESVGFEVTMKLDRTKFQMEDDIDAITDGLTTGDAVLFFYAGHGLEVENNNYLVPIDASVKRKHHVTQRCVRADYITQAMEGSGASLRVIVFDACRNNPFRSFMRSGKVGLATMQAPEGTIIAYSTAAGTEAADGEGDNSPFAKHFVDTVAADHPRGLEVTDLFRSVARQMKRETGQRAFLDLDASMEHYLLKNATEEIAAAIPKSSVKPESAGGPKYKKTITPFKDYRKLEIDLIRQHADIGISAAEAQLGFMYLVGKSPLTKDCMQAFAWTKKAADHNNARALNNMGYMYYNGDCVEKDIAQSAKYYKRSAAMGDHNGMHSLGLAYENGWGLEKDFFEARKVFAKAAELGNAKSQYELGHIYEEGLGVGINPKKALQWYQESADNGHDEAQFCLGRMYVLGKGTNKDLARGATWYKRSAKQGFLQAQFYLALMYKHGQGVSKDINQARRLLQKVSKSTNPEYTTEITQAKNELATLGN
jgi:TPR repeat protein